MNIKIITRGFLLATLLALFTTASAQKMTAEEQANKMTDWMKTNLKLTDDQVAKVQAINLKYANKMHEAKNSTQSKDEKKSSMKAESAAKDSEMKGVLTADQYKSYMAKKEEMKKDMKEKMMAKKKTT